MGDENTFQYNKRDSQGTKVEPVSYESFDFARYADYEASLAERQKSFLAADSGILVYRRVRADGVFYDKCRDYKESLALQLGALRISRTSWSRGTASAILRAASAERMNSRRDRPRR